MSIKSLKKQLMDLRIPIESFIIPSPNHIIIKINSTFNKKLSKFIFNKYDGHLSSIVSHNYSDRVDVYYNFLVNSVTVTIHAILNEGHLLKTISDVIPGAKIWEKELKQHHVKVV